LTSKKRKEDEAMSKLELAKNKTLRKNFVIFWGAIVGIAFFTCLLNTPQAHSGPVLGVTDDTILIGMHTPLTGPITLFSKEADFHEAIFLEMGQNIHGPI
jgi:hypothetical protein